MSASSPQVLYTLLQFESFQDTVSYYFFKYSENKFVILAYVAGGLILMILIYRWMAGRK